MRLPFLAAVLLGAALAGPATATADPLAELQRQVADTELAFARSMAERDHAAFASFLADETVFFTSREALRGKTRVAEFWKRFYEGPQAPFSWKPEQVQVLDSGTLALSSGPVHAPQGKLIGSFTSIWRLEKPGVWKIIFDKGCDACEDCTRPKSNGAAPQP